MCVPISGWIAFTIGNRFGRPRAWAAASGLLAATLFLTPAWGWTIYRVIDARTIDLRDDNTRIHYRGYVDENGRFAFVMASRELPREPGMPRVKFPTHAVVIDLETGEWRSEGPGSWFHTNSAHRREMGGATVPVSGVYLARNEEENGLWYDAQRAEPLPKAAYPPDPPALPGDLREGIEHEYRFWGAAGRGFCAWRKTGEREFAYYDPFRERYYLEGELFPEEEPPHRWRVKVRRGKWLVLALSPHRESYALEPGSGHRSAIPGLA